MTLDELFAEACADWEKIRDEEWAHCLGAGRVDGTILPASDEGLRALRLGRVIGQRAGTDRETGAYFRGGPMQESAGASNNAGECGMRREQAVEHPPPTTARRPATRVTAASPGAVARARVTLAIAASGSRCVSGS
jgi:hypothetical protein